MRLISKWLIDKFSGYPSSAWLGCSLAQEGCIYKKLFGRPFGYCSALTEWTQFPANSVYGNNYERLLVYASLPPPSSVLRADDGSTLNRQLCYYLYMKWVHRGCKEVERVQFPIVKVAILYLRRISGLVTSFDAICLKLHLSTSDVDVAMI
ncbi:hypothetical protein M514_07517 [Trichuris suis]|uniref:Uncharacterized protein n=1 Tax=Trichuris suis TaxID=68888 RepID=A0A085NE81_9BILA|nr:hypothetical protein M514_07517 [Trichuris suis]